MSRSILAIVVGYLVFAVPAFLLFRLTGHDPHAPATAVFVLLTIVFGVIVAFGAGYVAALIGRRSPIWHSAAVGIVLAGIALLSMALQWGRGGLWTQAAAVLVMAPSASLGGFLRAAQVCRPENSRLQYR
jgi:hypothetical protein